MGRQTTIVPAALLAMLAAGLLYGPARSPAGPPPAAPAEAPVAAGSVSTAAVTEGPSATGPVELLADYLDIDVSPRGLARSVRAAAARLERSDAALDSRRADLALVREFCALDITSLAPGVEDLRRVCTVLTTRDDPPPIPPADRGVIARFLAGYLDDVPQQAKQPPYAIERVSRDLASLDLASLRMQHVRARAAAAGVDAQFVLLTAPDPIDSYVGWYLDPFLDAVRRAVERHHYVMDRFHFPDWTPLRGPSASARTGHDDNPGLLLFRDRQSPRRLLMLLLVAETPTAGLEHGAFQRAARFLRAWNGPAYRVRVVGPIFSGTAPSLAAAIRRAGAESGVRFDIVTGTATSWDNRTAIEETGATFSATLHDSATLTRAAETFLAERVLGSGAWAWNGSGASPYARLTESNTGFGQGQLEADARHRERAHQAGAFDQALQVFFPLHISRLHAAGQQQQSAATQVRPLGTPSIRPLTLDDGRVARDQLPTLWPALAESATELMLNNVLRTVAEEHVRVVGIVATDARDTLFLTQQLASVAPDAVVYAMESDLLYTHPDFAAGTRGMLLVSTYPLYNRSQLWSYPGGGRRQREMFYSSLAEGLYNALTLQLAPDGPLPADQFPLDYAYPLRRCESAGCAPPVWVSVVGRDRVWPVRVMEPEDSGRYITRVAPLPAEADAGVQQAPLWAPGPTVGAAIVLLAVGLLHGWAFWRRRPAAEGPAGLFARPVPGCPRDAGTLRHLGACFWALLAVQGYLAALFVTWMGGSTAGPLATVVRVAGSIALAAGMVLVGSAALRVAWLLARQDTAAVGSADAGEEGLLLGTASARTGEDEDETSRATLAARFATGGTAAIAAVYFLAFLVDAAASRFPAGPDLTAAQVNALLWYERSVHVLSGVSPTLPVGALAVVIYAWGFQGLRRSRRPGGSQMDPRLDALDALTRHRKDRLDRDRVANGSAAVVLGVVVVYAFALRDGILSHEGLAYSGMYWWGGLLAELLVAGVLASLYFRARSVNARLLRLAEHPVLPACDRLPAGTLTPRNVIQRPRTAQAFALADRARRLAAAPGPPATAVGVAASLARQPEFAATPDRGREPAAAQAVWDTFHAEVTGYESRLWTTSRTFMRTEPLVRALIAHLEPVWDRASSPVVAAGMAGGAVPGAAAGRPRAAALEEEIVALHVTLALRDVLAGFAVRALFCLGAVFLLLASHTCFPFEPHRTLVSLAWTNVLVVTGMGTLGLLALERNPVLMRMAGLQPGERHLNGTLVWRIIVFAVLPLFSLLAVQFPEISTALIRWIEPVQRAL